MTSGTQRSSGRPRRRWWVAALTMLVLAVPACSGSDPQTGGGAESTFNFPATDVGSFVRTAGTSFTVDGTPWRFVGVNVYDAAATDRYSCAPDARQDPAELYATFRELHDRYGVTVIRFWAYQTYTDGGRDFTGMDRVLDYARRTGIRVLPVLEDGPGYCTTMSDVLPKADYQGDTWFLDGYRNPFGTAALSYRDYAKIVVERYRDDPTILGWSLINEADTSARDAQGRSALVDFTQDMTSIVRAADPNHLITVGTQSNGARGASGPDFAAVYGLPGVDFAEVHDWGYWGDDDDPLPGGQGGHPPAADDPRCQVTNAPLACSFAQLAAIGKPLFVGEAGITRGDGGRDDLARRATQLEAKMTAAFTAGASGYLLWRITRQVTDKYDILTTDGDPLLVRLAERAAVLAPDTTR